MIRATTETGSVYEIRHGRWSKNGYGVEKIWTMKTPEPDFQPATYDELHAGLADLPEVRRPVVGKRLYVAGRESWALSTVVVKVEDYDDEEN